MNKNWSLPQMGFALAGLALGALAQRRRGALQRPSWRRDIEQLTAASAELRASLVETKQVWERRLAALEQSRPWLGAIENSEGRLGAQLKLQELAIVSQFTEQRDRLVRLERQVREAEPAPAKLAVPVDLEAQIGRIQNLEMRVADHQRRLDSSAALVSALEKAVSTGMLRLEERLQEQTQSLTRLSAGAKQTAEELQRVVEAIEWEARPAPQESKAFSVAACQIGPLSTLVDEDAAIARMFHLQL